MKIISKSEDKLIFEEKIEEELANAIRRGISEIPVLAINEIEFYKNDSVLYDEIIANRLGLIPLVMVKGMKLKEKCSCNGKGCSKCEIKIKLSEKAERGPKIVYSKDLSGHKVVYENIPIVKLEEGQEIELLATATLGRGIDHTKYLPGLAYYRRVAKITLKNNCENIVKCAEVCPKKVFRIIDGKTVEVDDRYNCDMCRACIEKCKELNEECITIEDDEGVIFTIESFGMMSPEDILKGAINALNDNLKELKNS